MSIHNIGFNEEMAKIIFQLSSNIIKYAPICSSEDVNSLSSVYSTVWYHILGLS